MEGTVLRPCQTVLKPCQTAYVVAEAMVALVLADAVMEKFGGDSVQEIVANWQAFRDRTAARFVKS